VITDATTDAAGGFSFSIAGSDVGRMLLLEADLSGDGATTYRALVFGVTDSVSLVAAQATGGGAQTAEILVDPSSEGAVRLLSRLPGECDPNSPPAGATTACEPTIDQTSNIPAQNIVAATRVASDDGAAYAGMTDEDAAESGMSLAAEVAGAVTFQVLYRAADGTAYQFIQTVGFARSLNPRDPANGEVYRINSVAGSSSAEIKQCTAFGAAPGERVFVYTGAISGGMIDSVATTARTAVLTKPTVDDPIFDPQGSGRLTIGSGPSALNVCAAAADCDSAGVTVPLDPVTESGGGLASACKAAAHPPCSQTNGPYEALSFGLPSDAGGQCSAEPTTEATICSPAPADGFSLSAGQAVVFVYRDASAAAAFSAGFSFFSIDFDGLNTLDCPAHTVFSGRVQTNSLPPTSP
jgi:hypothetical protein